MKRTREHSRETGRRDGGEDEERAEWKSDVLRLIPEGKRESETKRRAKGYTVRSVANGSVV